MFDNEEPSLTRYWSFDGDELALKLFDNWLAAAAARVECCNNEIEEVIEVLGTLISLLSVILTVSTMDQIRGLLLIPVGHAYV